MASDVQLKAKMSKGTASEAKTDGDLEKRNGASKGFSVDRVNKKKELENILHSPDTYIGSVEPVTDDLWIYKPDEGMVKGSITYVPGLIKIFDVILANAADQKQRDPKMNTIKVDIDPEENFIRIYYNGKGTSVVEDKEEKMDFPSQIFGHLPLTSSSYNDEDEKATGGSSNCGVKLSNLPFFISSFILETASKDEGKKFKQTWSANMTKVGTQEIVSHSGTDFTQVTFYPDLAKFKMNILDKDTISLLSRRAFDVAASIRGVKFFLNGKRLLRKNFKNYIDNCLKIQDGEQNPTKLKGIPHLEDAVNAGTAESIHCTLILTKGDSAKSQAVTGLGVVGRAKYGVYVLQEELLNVREASRKEISENSDINNLIKILGLKHEKNYESVEDLKSLRYGHLMMMTDQDPHGCHFTGLIINFLHHNWPNLLRLPFLEQLITPIVTATKGIGESVECLRFYSLLEYEEWKSDTENWQHYRIKHYEGLGSMTSEEMESVFTNLPSHRVIFKHNGDDDDRAISMAFSKRHSGQHRDWLDFWNKASKWLRESPYPKLHLYRRETRQVSFYEFVHRGLVRYTNMEHERYTRSIMDGLTVGERKIIFTCIKRSDKEEVKVAQLAGLVAARTSLCNYDEENLTRTIIGLAHDFVGTNNINLLQPIGHFGTRLQGGEDAASPRQISTLMSHLTRIIFHPYDDRLLKHRTDGKRLIEPEFYAPIIPMILVNGIGTDWTTSRLIYNPRDIIGNIMRMLNGEEPIYMNPWIKGYQGSIQRVDDNTYVISGEVSKLSATQVVITELPLGISVRNYRESVMENLLHGSEKIPPLITGYNEYHTDTTVRFVVNMTEEKMQQAESQGFHDLFRLHSTHTVTPTLLYDPNGFLKNYDSNNDILKTYFDVRLNLFEERKKLLTGDLQASCKKLTNEIRYVRAIWNGDLIVNRKKINVLVEELRRLNFDPDPLRAWMKNQNVNTEDEVGDDDFSYLLMMNTRSLTLEGLNELLQTQKFKMKALEIALKKSARDLWRDNLTFLLKKMDQKE